MLKITENRSSFSDSELVQMVKRDNNPKRNYLLVNSNQGKHIPADPSAVIKMCSELASEMKETLKNEKLLFIGFAETATAIGACTASFFEGSYYVHTTREYDPDSVPVAEFREEHSHAAEQILYCSDWEKISADADRIVFAEDEVTTAKTIMNFITVLKKTGKVNEDMKFSVCSVLNGMTDERLAELRSNGVDFFWLVRHSASPDTDEVCIYRDEDVTLAEKNCLQYSLKGRTDPRYGTYTDKYVSKCRELAKEIISLTDFKSKRVAVIGTEECMYPAVCTADIIKNNTSAFSVVTHSTTRSPIAAEKTEGYPIKARSRVESLYDEKRQNFIYNTDEAYDLVIIVTDSLRDDIYPVRLLNSFVCCENFIIVRWEK